MSKAYIESLQSTRARETGELRKLLDDAAGRPEGQRELTADEQTREAGLTANLDALDKRIEQLTTRMKDDDAAEARLAELLARPAVREGGTGDDGAGPPEGGKGGEDFRAELRNFMLGKGGRRIEVTAGAPRGTADYRALTPEALRGQAIDERTLSKLSAGAGANTVKTSFYDRLTAHLIEVSGVLQAGPTVLQTATGESIQFPKTTAHSTAALVAEAGTIGASDPAFGQVTLDAFKYGLLLQLSHELVNDTSVDLLGYVAMQAGRALGNAFGAHLVTGDGSAKPLGVLAAASLGVTGAASVGGAFTADNLIDLKYSVIAPYRSGASVGYMMRDASVGALRKLKDTTGQYLWQPSLTVGAPSTFDGEKIFTDPNMPAIGLGAKSVLYGDFSQYFVRRVEGLRFERSDDFAFNTDLITYRAIIRGDGDLIDTTGALKYFAGNAA